jgi:hypothetical protein
VRKITVFDRFYEFIRHVENVQVKAESAHGVYKTADIIYTQIYVISFSACCSRCWT